MASLNFKGKTAVWNHHLSVPYHTLEKNKDWSVSGNDEDENLIIEGDNLLALKALLPKYQGKIKCIYIDPPYNTGSEGWVYNDNVNNPIIKEWIGEIVGKDGEDLTRHDKWLCMMTPRLKLLRELLSDDGVIFISIDENEVHHLRLIMNEAFGEENYITTITWQRKKESSNDSNNISIKAEYILIYSKSNLSVLKSLSLSEEYIKSSYHEPTSDFPDGKWRPVPIATTKGHKSGGYTYEISTPGGKKHLREWAYPEGSYQKLVDSRRVYFGKDQNGVPQRVIYAFESEGIPASNLWNNVWDAVATNKQGKKEIINLFNDGIFETPKPVQLVKLILELGSNKDSIVLDSFAGSGTTAQAVMELNKVDGNRKFILIQIPEEIKEKTNQGANSPAYAEGYRWVHEITRERVKRVIERDKIDTGFTYYKLGPSIDGRTILEGKELPNWENFAKYVHYLATGKPVDNIVAPDSSWNIQTEDGKDTGVYLIYKDDIATLKNLAITREWLELVKGIEGKKVVYAPACFLEKEVLDEHSISFVQIPFNLFHRK